MDFCRGKSKSWRGKRLVFAALTMFACGDDGGGTITLDSGAVADSAPSVDADPGLPTCETAAFTGAGTAESPYQLCDGALLNLIASSDAFLAATYEMDRDIVAPASFTSIGPEFGGTLLGNGHLIADLGSSDTPLEQGLFVSLGADAVISDLRLEAVVSDIEEPLLGLLAGTNQGSITNVAVSGSLVAADHGGLLVGQNLGTIDRCEVSGTLEVRAHSGGVSGENLGSISRCHSSAVVTGTHRQGGVVGTLQPTGVVRLSTATGTITGQGVEAGCLVGSVFGGEIESSSGRCASVTNGAAAGGLVGGTSKNDSSITNSYAWTLAIVGSSAGGLVGVTDGVVTVAVTSSYFNSDISAASTVGTGLTSAQLQEQSSFDAWDFGAKWQSTQGEPPALRWRTDLPSIGSL